MVSDDPTGNLYEALQVAVRTLETVRKGAVLVLEDEAATAYTVRRRLQRMIALIDATLGMPDLEES